jgi:hypothetical protein
MNLNHSSNSTTPTSGGNGVCAGGFGVRFHPQHDRDMIHAQTPPNSAIIDASAVKSHRLVAHFIGIAMRLGLWRVTSLAASTTIALAAGGGTSRFHLVFVGLAIRTEFHSSSLSLSTFSPLPGAWNACYCGATYATLVLMNLHALCPCCVYPT